MKFITYLFDRFGFKLGWTWYLPTFSAKNQLVDDNNDNKELHLNDSQFRNHKDGDTHMLDSDNGHI